MPRPHRSTHLALLAVLLAACGGPASSPAPPELERGAVLRFVTWNVHDLFDEQDRTVAPGDGDTVETPAAVEAKLAAVGRVLSRLDPDVVVLQEVENFALLQRLATGPLAGRGFRAYLSEGNDPRGIDVGLLSRLPFEPGPSHLDERGPDGRHVWSRDLLHVSLSVAPRRVVLLGAHLVSRLDPRNDARRLLQASRLRTVADEARRAPDHPVVLILGDLNDAPTAPALAPLLGDGVYLDAGSSLPAANAWTWSGSGLRERMDYALVARDDAGGLTSITVSGGADIAAASDHRPLGLDVWLSAPGQ